MKKLLSLLPLGLLLAACVSAPPTTPSQVALKPGGLGLGTAAEPAIADRWWNAFGDPQLDSLVDEALKGNPTLAAALARVRMAQSQLASSKAATWPQVTLDGNEQRERFSNDYLIPPPYAGTTQWIGTVQANLSWSVDLFGKEQSGIDRARASANAAQLDATAARLLLAGSVTQSYIALSRAYVLADVAEEAVKERAGVSSLTAGRVRAGLDTLASQKQAEALLAIAREDRIGADSDRELAVHALAALTGHGAEAYTVARPKLNDAALALPDALPADLLARRADIAAAQARIDAAFSGREVARKAFYPDINLLGLAGVAAIGLGPLATAASTQYGGGAAIHLPIFDAGVLRAQYADATAGLDESVADYNAAVLTAVRQTADAITTLHTVQSEAEQQRQALAAARASFELTARRYRSGLNPQQNVLDTEAVLIQARRQYASLSSDDASARVALLMALGGGFDAAQNPSTTSLSTQENGHE
jgi:NodT family efflux transporter outer membrane factor (OMF) lipoprotein